MVSMDTQNVILCGYSTGRKNRSTAQRYSPVAVSAADAVNLSLSLKMAIKHSFSANIAIFLSICQKILSSLHAWSNRP